MRREKYIEDYEDFEPEQRSWPLFMLSFLVPLLPFVMNILFGSNGFTPFLLADYILAVLPLFSASLCVKDGEKVWMMMVSGILYFVVVLIKWAVLKSSSGALYPLSIPFALALSPSLLSLNALAFFNKRRRSNWLGWAFLAFLASAILVYFTYASLSSFTPYILLYPSLCLLLSLLLFFVTRRTESTPWYITTVLVLMLVASITLYPGLIETLSTGTVNDSINVLVKFFLYGFPFWYTLSFLFVFSSLAGKSSYRKVEVKDEKNEENVEEVVVPPTPGRVDPNIRRGYTAPPEYSRFDTSSPVRKDERVEEAPKSRVVDEKVENIACGDEYQGSKDDKWYNFIEGGVKTSERERNNLEDDSRSSRQYPERRDDRYYDDHDRRYRDDRYYDDRDRRYRDDRYYDDRDRRYRDDRYYDDRDRRSRDDRYYDDRDRRYYDDDYSRYDDRDGRRR